MADHKTLTDPEIHEPKGAATASAGEAYIADGTGSGSWDTPQIEGQASAPANYIPVTTGSGGMVWVSPLVRADTLLIGRSFDTQTPPSNIGDSGGSIQVNFGPAQETESVTLNAAGTITIAEDGIYLITFTARNSRNSGAGEAALAIRYLIDDVPVGSPTVTVMDDGDFTVPFTATVELTLVAGQTLKVEAARDGNGTDDGILAPYTVSSGLAAVGWGDAPSAAVTIYRQRVGSA